MHRHEYVCMLLCVCVDVRMHAFYRYADLGGG